jgi:hypothetical protein
MGPLEKAIWRESRKPQLVPFQSTRVFLPYGEELVGSYLYQVHLYHWLESNDYGRFLADDDL